MIKSCMTILIFLITFCCSVAIKPPVNPIDISSVCFQLCDVMIEHDCSGKMGSPGPDEIFGTLDDLSCDEACERVVSIAPWLLEKAICGAKSNSCEDIDACMEIDL